MKEILKMKADLFLWQHNRHQAFCGYTVGVTRVKGVYTAYVRLVYVIAHNLQEIKKYYLLETTTKCNARQWTTKIRPLIIHSDTGCPRRNVQYLGRVFLMLNYTDITQNTYIQSWTVTEIIAREKCGHLAFPRSICLQLYREPPLPVVIWLRAERTLTSFTAHELRPTR